jgi:hypothetical protein
LVSANRTSCSKVFSTESLRLVSVCLSQPITSFVTKSVP